MPRDEGYGDLPPQYNAEYGPVGPIHATYVDNTDGAKYTALVSEHKSTTRVVMPKGTMLPGEKGRTTNMPKGSTAPPSGEPGTAFAITMRFDEFKRKLASKTPEAEKYPTGDGDLNGYFTPGVSAGAGRRRRTRRRRSRKTRRSRK